MRVTFYDPAIFAHHVFAIFLRQLERGGERFGRQARILANRINAFKNALRQARYNFRMIAVKIVPHRPDVCD